MARICAEYKRRLWMPAGVDMTHQESSRRVMPAEAGNQFMIDASAICSQLVAQADLLYCARLPIALFHVGCASRTSPVERRIFAGEHVSLPGVLVRRAHPTRIKSAIPARARYISPCPHDRHSGSFRPGRLQCRLGKLTPVTRLYANDYTTS